MQDLAALGLVGVPNWPNHGKPYMLPNWLDPWPNPFYANVAAAGYGGHGVDLAHLMDLWLALPLALLFIAAKIAMTKFVFLRLAAALGVRKSKTAGKFAYQMWLFSFYTASTVFGYLAQRGGGWLAFPQNDESTIAMYRDFPSPPSWEITWCVTFEVTFYLSEILWLFVEARRSDFLEYLLHHIVSLILIAMSYSGYDHRPGCYILLLHDSSDIFLCLGKCFHYAGLTGLSNAAFGIFVSGCVFMRLYCLPILGYYMFYASTTARMAAVNFWVLVCLLFGVIQLLHVYWFTLIVNVISRLMRGVRGDNRSESDRDDDGKAEQRRVNRKKQ